MSEGSAKPRGPYDAPVDVYNDREEMFKAFIELFHENGDYWEVMKPLVRFRTPEDDFQWVYGEHFDSSEVHVNRAFRRKKYGFDREEYLNWVRFDPDGLPYSDGGVLVTAYSGMGLRDTHIAVHTESPERGVDISNKQVTVEKMEVHRHA